MSGSEHAAWAPGYTAPALLRQGRRARIVRATRSTSGADVVLKILPEPLGRAELNHLRDLDGVPGVVPLLDAGTTADGDLFVVLPYYPDGSFGDMLARKGPAPLQEAAAVSRSVAAALGSIHGRGLVHDDVCPGNVLRAGRTPVLTGFGSVHRSGEALPAPAPGTESFLHSPPEALRGGPRTPASDVYRLASTVWTMLAGRTPFSPADGAPFDPRTYAEHVLTREPGPITRPDLSRQLLGVLLRALSKLPEERFETPAAFASAFEQARTSPPSPTFSGPTGGHNAPSGGQAPLSAPTPSGGQPPLSAPTTPPPPPYAHKPPRDASGPQTPPATAWFASSGPQTPQTPPAAPPAAGTASPRTADHHSPPAPTPSAPSERPARPNRPTGLEGSRIPATDAGGTAEIMMARLRGEEVSPLRAWARLEGWTGTAESSFLPVDEASGDEREDSPHWDPAHEPGHGRPRWRRHLHIAVTVCGVLLATSVSSVFAATSAPPPAAVASEEGEEAGSAPSPPPEEEPSPQVVEPAVPPEVSAPSGVVLADNLGAVELNWTDNSGGTASFFVLGGPSGHDPATVARTGPGVVSAQVVTDDTLMEYCFTVVAVDGAASAADEVCTTRAADRAEAERLAEEEAAAEEEEEAEEEEAEEDAPSAEASEPAD